MTYKQLYEGVVIALRNMLIGTSAASLSLLASPQLMLQYLADSLFLHRAVSGRRGVPQKNVAEVLRSNGTESIQLGNLNTSEAWLWPQAQYTQDIVSLC